MEKQMYRPSTTALLNPRLDSNFKAIFTDNSDEGRLALKSFLEAMLDAEVSDIEIVSNENAEESATDKQARFDVTCVLNGVEHVNIEMQGEDKKLCYDKRAEYYSAHLLNHNVTKGLAWNKIPKTYQISVLDFIYDNTTRDFFSVYNMRTEDGRKLSDRMSIIFIELKKLLNIDDDIQKLTKAQKWGKFLLYADNENRQEYINNLCQSEGGLMAAQTVLNGISQDYINWVEQWHRESYERDQLTLKEMAEEAQENLDAARQELEVTEKALESVGQELETTSKELESKSQELESKKQELKTKSQELESTSNELQTTKQALESNNIETARKAIFMGLSNEQVIQLTGLSIEQVIALQTENAN